MFGVRKTDVHVWCFVQRSVLNELGSRQGHSSPEVKKHIQSLGRQFALKLGAGPEIEVRDVAGWPGTGQESEKLGPTSLWQGAVRNWAP